MPSKVVPTSELASERSLEAKIAPTLQLSTEDIIQIVVKASTLPERLSDKFIVNKDETEKDLIESRLNRWCQVVAKGNKQKFVRHLAWDGLNPTEVRRALGSVSLANEKDLPNWASTLKEGMQAAVFVVREPAGDHRERRYLDADKPLPFEDVLVPFIDLAKRQLIERADNNYRLLTDKAHAQLEQSLLAQLTGLCVSALELEFSIFRALHNSALTMAIAQLQGDSSRQQYRAFVNNLLKDGLLAFFQEYSVLARLVATAVDFWVDAVGEFLSRLAVDWHEIQSTFQANEALGKVISLETALSDPHNCGRSVIIMQFASNKKLVYKPKNLGLEKAYYDLLAWINDRDIVLEFKLLKVIDRSTHGWMEFAEALPCANEAAVKRFYQRAGMLMCIVHILRGTDCHCENLIAFGEQPVIVDLETLLHHRTWASQDDADARSKANERLQDSVAGTALLPGWQLVPYEQNEGLKIDLSGLGGSGEQEIPYRALTWKHINTDSMSVAHEEVKLKHKQNRPFGEGISVSLNKYSAELIDGFEQMYRFFSQQKAELLASNSLAVFKHQKVRLVLRNTSVYFAILHKSLTHKYLRDGVEHSIELDLLSRAFLASEKKHPFWGILAAEKQALEQLDIPYFTAFANSEAIALNSEREVKKFFQRPSYDDVIFRLQHLNSEGLRRQISVIRGSLYACLTQAELNLSLPEIPSNEPLASLDRMEILQQAIAIAQAMKKTTIRGADGSTTWIGMKYLADAQRFQLQPLGYSLYDGDCGIGLFLAAIAKVTGKKQYGDLALASIQSIRKILQNTDLELQRKLTEQIGVGGARGIASLVYSLVRMADFLGERELLSEAEQLAAWMVPDRVTVKQKPDILHGSAGIILSLLSLYRATKKPVLLERAIAWGQNLLALRSTSDEGFNIWQSKGKPLIGFSSGMAGIAYTLLQLYAVSQNPVFSSAAREAIFYEQNYLSSQVASLDFESVLDNNIFSSLNSWGNGLPGISIARLGCLEVLDIYEIRQELANYLQIISRSELQPLDNLVCGNFSQIEFLILATQQLSHSKSLEIARNRAVRVIHRARDRGCYQLLPNLGAEIYNPGFCQGTAGIGYELLRLTYPNAIPSVLLWK